MLIKYSFLLNFLHELLMNLMIKYKDLSPTKTRKKGWLDKCLSKSNVSLHFKERDQKMT